MRATSTPKTIVQEISRRIVSGELEPGTRLPTESEMQEQWGVSRSVVREAMKVLATQGLVRVEQGRGTFVGETDIAPLRTQIEWTLQRSLPGSTPSEDFLSPNALDQWDYVIDVRSVLEIAVAERAAQNAEGRDVAELQAAIEEMQKEPDELDNYVETDLRFHRALAAATKNPLWPALVNSMNDLLRRYFAVGYHGHDNALLTAREHRAVLDAVRAGDAAAAAAAMRAHMKTSRRDLNEARRKNRIPT